MAKPHGTSLVWAAVAALLLLAVFTGLSDPFGFIGWPLSDSVSRPGRLEQDRFIKPWDILLQRPATILLGTSRVKEGLNPALAPALFGRTYNGGIDGATIAETHSLLNFAIAHDGRLKTAIIELFFAVFVGDVPQTQDFTPRGARFITDPVVATFSPEAIRLAYDTLNDFAHRRHISVAARRNGFIFDAPPISSGGPAFVSGYAQSARSFAQRIAAGVSQATLLELSVMQSDCERSHISCVFFASPLGGFVLSCIERGGTWDVFAAWRRALAKSSVVADFSDIAFDDLDGATPHWTNTLHFSAATGNEIMRDIASDEYARVRNDTVDSSTSALKRRVREWTQHNLTAAPDSSCP